MIAFTRVLALFSLALSCALAPVTVSAQEFYTEAPHAVLMDGETGLILFEKDAQLPMEPASMTKIMTASLVFDQIRSGAISLDTQFTVSEEAWRRGGKASGSSTMFLEVGSKVSVGDLLKGVIIQSGNDACIVLAEGIAGSETAFADMMTERARELGLSSATFKNATGWPHPEHKISAIDLARLSQYVISEYPEFYDLYAQRKFMWNGISQNNRNPLLGKFTGADGLKTGHTESSKYGMVGSAVRADRRIIMVLNGLESNRLRTSESLRVMDAAFTGFGVYKLYPAGAVAGQAEVFMGQSENIDLTTEKPISIGLYKPLRDKMRVTIQYDGPIAAPIQQGDEIAKLVVSFSDKPDLTFPLIAAKTVERKGAIARALTALKSKF